MSELKSQDKPFGIPKWAVWEAYQRVKANKGAAGVDGQSVEDFEQDRSKRASGLGCWRFVRFGWVIVPGLSGFPGGPPAHVVDHGPVDHGAGTSWECLVITD